jgi:hypothetical protein
MKDNWISVRDSLPEKTGYYTVYTKSKKVSFGRFYAEYWGCKNIWRSMSSGALKPTHWQPIPAPPKDGK